MFYVYLLKSVVDGKYYIGQTEDIDGRVQRHNDGYVPATRGRRPLILIGCEPFVDRHAARYREFSLKKSAAERKKFYAKFESPHSLTDRAHPSEG